MQLVSEAENFGLTLCDLFPHGDELTLGELVLLSKVTLLGDFDLFGVVLLVGKLRSGSLELMLEVQDLGLFLSLLLGNSLISY